VSSLRIRADAAAQVLVDDLEHPEPSEPDGHHLRRVLRLRDGEHVVVTDGNGAWRLCAVATGGRLAPDGPVTVEPAPERPVCVWLPALKGDRAEWAVAKLVELGVDELGLLACDRSVVRLDEDVSHRVLTRWTRVAREAACQSRRVRLPAILGPCELAEATSQGATRCDIEGDELPSAVTSLAVGPEGGWSDAERALSPAAVGLTPSVLRSETAAVAAGVVLAVAARPARHAAGSEAQ
jgi:16S rRNA (uracil1498-N3)-methyltransferase